MCLRISLSFDSSITFVDYLQTSCDIKLPVAKVGKDLQRSPAELQIERNFHRHRHTCNPRSLWHRPEERHWQQSRGEHYWDKLLSLQGQLAVEPKRRDENGLDLGLGGARHRILDHCCSMCMASDPCTQVKLLISEALEVMFWTGGFNVIKCWIVMKRHACIKNDLVIKLNVL